LIRDRLLEALGIQTEPELVERAPRRERWKRQAWMGASTLLSFGIVFAGLLGLDQLVRAFPPTGIARHAVAIIAIGGALVIDTRWVFPWGVDRWDLVVPWQFREEQAKGGDHDA